MTVVRAPKHQYATAIALIMGFALVAISSIAWGDTEAELDALRERIANIAVELEQQRGTRDDVREQLALTERRIAELDAEHARTEQALRDTETRIEELSQTRTRKRQDLDVQHDALARLVRLSFRSGTNTEYVRLLLSQDDPARIGRMLSYHRYIADARRSVSRELSDRLAALAAVEQEMNERSLELLNLSERMEADLAAADLRREERAGLLAAIERDIEDRGVELERMREDEARLSELVARLEREAATPPPAQPAEPFGGMQGRLELPVQARITGAFGQPRNGDGPAWEGIFLAAQEGQPVHAVHDGRVVYADWLRGFGLLLILDHGDGYMSLYSHNQRLENSVGDWVATGDVIARVGNTGGLERAGLYFEIRHQGRPRDPMNWIRRG